MKNKYFSLAAGVALAVVAAGCAAPAQNAQVASVSNPECATGAARPEWEPKAQAAGDMESSWRQGVEARAAANDSEVDWRPGVRHAVKVAAHCQGTQDATY